MYKRQVEVHTLIHPEGRFHDQELVEGKPGRTNPSTYRGHSAMEPHTNPRDQESLTFAKQVSDYLEQSRQQGLFQKLYIAAAPSFLGFLRQALSRNTASLVAGEVNKDIIHLKPVEICAAVPFVL